MRETRPRDAREERSLGRAREGRRSIDRSIAHSLARSSSLDRSLDRSIDRSLDRSLDSPQPFGAILRPHGGPAMGYLAAVVMTGFVSNAPLTGQNTKVSLDEGSRAQRRWPGRR